MSFLTVAIAHIIQCYRGTLEVLVVCIMIAGYMYHSFGFSSNPWTFLVTAIETEGFPLVLTTDCVTVFRLQCIQ